MKKILYILSGLLVLLGACVSPEHPEEMEIETMVSKITIQLTEGDRIRTEASFEFEVMDQEEEEIFVVLPWYYPEDSENVISDISKVKLIVSVGRNCEVIPAVNIIDLNEKTYFTVRNRQNGETKSYYVTGEVRRSSEKQILTYNILTEPKTTCLIFEDSKSIMIPTIDDFGERLLADVELSLRATMSPDPRTEELNYDEPFDITVTADDGSQVIYRVDKWLPPKIAAGVKLDEGVMLWKRSLGDYGLVDEGCANGQNPSVSTHHNTTSFAVSGDYLVLNTRDYDNLYINRMTGNVVGNMNLGTNKGSLVNFYIAGDRKGNFLIGPFLNNAVGPYQVWKYTGPEDTNPTLLIDYTFPEAVSTGRKISVQGDLDGDAYIMSTIQSSTKVLRWTVRNGSLVSQTPETIEVSGRPSWGIMAKAMGTAMGDPESFFVTGNDSHISNYTLSYVNSAGQAAASLTFDQSNEYVNMYNINDLDVVEFNNAQYVALLEIFGYAWGYGNMAHIYDATQPMNLAGSYIQAADWSSESTHPWGNNTNGTGSISWVPSSDGYRLHLYYMFTTGHIACYQFDCIDLDGEVTDPGTDDDDEEE